MTVLLLLLIILIMVVLLWFWSQRRKHFGKIEASNVTMEVRPAKVILSESEPEERPARRRTGETQELRRKVVHGPFRAIDDRGESSDVQMGRES